MHEYQCEECGNGTDTHICKRCLGDYQRQEIELKQLRAIVDAINKLRKEDADSVTILCDDADFDGPNSLVTCYGNWCSFIGRSFCGDTLAEALAAAVAARKAAEKEA